MSRYNTITDGATVVDIAKAEGGYDYFGYVRSASDDTWIIMRINTAGTEFRFAVGSGDYATAWTNRASQNYARASSYKY